MLVKFGNTGFQKFLWRSNWSDFLGIFFNSVITKWTACSPNIQKSWREAQMTGKFVILFLQKSEAEKTNKMAMQSLPPFELPTNFKKRDHMSCSSLVITFMIKRFQTRIFFFFFTLSFHPVVGEYQRQPTWGNSAESVQGGPGVNALWCLVLQKPKYLTIMGDQSRLMCDSTFVGVYLGERI